MLAELSSIRTTCRRVGGNDAPTPRFRHPIGDLVDDHHPREPEAMNRYCSQWYHRRGAGLNRFAKPAARSSAKHEPRASGRRKRSSARRGEVVQPTVNHSSVLHVCGVWGGG